MNTNPSHDRPQSDGLPSRTGGPPTDLATRYRTLFDALEEGFCVFEMIYDEAGEPVDYRFKEINRAFTAQTGLREEDVKAGRTMLEMAPAHEKVWFERYGRVAKTGEPITIEDRADALGRWYSVHAFRIGGEGSVEVGALFKDVTEKYETARAQAEERARQDRRFENAKVATFDLDVPGDRVYANGLLARLFGVSVADAAGGPLAVYFDAIHPDDRERTSATIVRSLETGGRYEVQYRVVGSDGEERTVLARGRHELGPGGARFETFRRRARHLGESTRGGCVARKRAKAHARARLGQHRLLEPRYRDRDPEERRATSHPVLRDGSGTRLRGGA